MAKKPKTPGEPESTQVRSGDAADNGQDIGVKRPKSTRKRAPRTSSKSQKTKPQLRDDDVRTRAYFISEMRARLSLPGDAQSDWLEARRQLLEELGET